MAFAPFPKKMQVKVLELEFEDTARLGSFVVSSAIELQHIRIMLVKHGTDPSGTTLKLRLGNSKENYAVYIESNQINLSDVSTDEYWTGWVRFDFSGEVLDPDLEYHVGLETTNYVASDDVYIAYAFDDVFGTNAFNASDDFGAAMQIVGGR